MATQRKSIKLLPHERKLLVKLYLKWRIPIEQFESRPAELAALVKEWHHISGHKHTANELIHYMRTQRKRGLWVKLGGRHMPAPPLPEMSVEDLDALVVIYEENVAVLGQGSDNIAYDDDIADLLVKSFFEMTGRTLPAHVLTTRLTALRKRGLLTKVSDMPQANVSGYDDTEQVPG